ncbi:hypothetical protein [Mongoliitalea lutea]|uniref:Uncharacterized protein n=1 Tax=Mongoliitalea lutea TaxID=849756 RepID=A0A8J3G3P0_9BACT|nr:hypothetical protein [Mongoliitalea lutea]GHB23945.1 hypothetical protein GCM10008106_00720 [Mongoliitalea lutea]
MKYTILILSFFLHITHSSAQFSIDGIWTNNVKHSNGSFVVASRLQITNNQGLRAGQFNNLNFEWLRIIGSDWSYPSGINFGANGLLQWNSTATRHTFDAPNNRHILAIPTGTRTYVKPGINRQVRETWYVLFAFYKLPFNNQLLPVAMRETSTFATVSGTPQIQEISNPLLLWNAIQTVKRDSVQFIASGTANTGPNSNFQNASVDWKGSLPQDVTVNRPINVPSNLSMPPLKLDQTKNTVTIQFTGIQTLTVDQESCNGQQVTAYRQSAEYVGILETWMATSTSCARPSGALFGGILLNRPGNQGLSGVLQLTMNQQFLINQTKTYTIPNGQFQNARIVIGGSWSEVNPCTSLEQAFSIKSTLLQSNTCRSIFIKDLTLGDNTIEIGNNTDRVRLHFKVSQ